MAGHHRGQEPPTYRGMAPDARIVSVKVGVADGGTDVSQVIAAIDWVVQHRNDNDLNIRVINLSYGTNSAQDSRIDPLAFAAERAWKEGIVVVAAGGNYGFQSHMNNAPALADPAIDRYVLAVGSSDSIGHAPRRPTTRCRRSRRGRSAERRAASTSSRPATHIQGLRVPSSYLDQNHPGGTARQPATSGAAEPRSRPRWCRARSPSSSQKHPDATPDQVKKLLMTHRCSTSTGRPRRSVAVSCSSRRPSRRTCRARPRRGRLSTGTGSLDQSRGTDRLTPTTVSSSTRRAGHLRPAVRLGRRWRPSRRARRAGPVAPGTATPGPAAAGPGSSVRQHVVRQLVVRQLAGPASSWCGNSWSGNSWSGSSWSGSSWSGNSWSGNSWSTASWD